MTNNMTIGIPVFLLALASGFGLAALGSTTRRLQEDIDLLRSQVRAMDEAIVREIEKIRG